MSTVEPLVVDTFATCNRVHIREVSNIQVTPFCYGKRCHESLVFEGVHNKGIHSKEVTLFTTNEGHNNK